MKANELRIGNIVGWRNAHQKLLGEKSEVKAIGIKYILIGLRGSENFAEFTLSELEPIPLTEEWLIKFGFCKECFYYQNGWQDKRDEIEVCIGSDGVCELARYTIGIATFKHVHQLQNLYHALTGEELKIKEDE